MKLCYILFEYFRQKLVELNIVDYLTNLLKEENNSVLKDILIVLRALILDDDVRVEFGHAHEHARIIASQTILPIINLIKSKIQTKINSLLILFLQHSKTMIL